MYTLLQINGLYVFHIYKSAVYQWKRNWALGPNQQYDTNPDAFTRTRNRWRHLMQLRSKSDFMHGSFEMFSRVWGSIESFCLTSGLRKKKLCKRHRSMPRVYPPTRGSEVMWGEVAHFLHWNSRTKCQRWVECGHLSFITVLIIPGMAAKKNRAIHVFTHIKSLDGLVCSNTSTEISILRSIVSTCTIYIFQLRWSGVGFQSKMF